MQNDKACIGLSKAVDKLIPQLSAAIDNLSTWDKIDKLNEAELDELAWELNILWYDKTASVEAKRDVVKNSDLVYQRLGTKWAVDSVIQSYFGDGYMLPWYEYPDGEGEPGHFRVYSTNPSISNEKLTDFLAILEKVKRKSAILDEIIIIQSMNVSLHSGMAIHETSHETHGIGYKPIT